MFDLTLSPLYLIDGLEQTELPGLYAANALKRTARGRSGDQIILFLTLAGNAPLSAENMKQLLTRLADHYFQSAGSVTASLRSVCEALNTYLLNRNLRNTSTGRQSAGLLTLAAIHDQNLFVAHAGPVHSFYLSSGDVQHWYDAQTGGRGLGLSKSLGLRYYQAPLKAGDRLLISPDAPSIWTSQSLSGGSALSHEQLRRRLLNQTPPNFSAVVVQFQPSAGPVAKISRLRLSAPAPSAPSLDLADTAARPASRPAPSSPVPAAAPAASTPAPAAAPPAPVSVYPAEATAPIQPSQIPDQPAAPSPETAAVAELSSNAPETAPIPEIPSEPVQADAAQPEPAQAKSGPDSPGQDLSSVPPWEDLPVPAVAPAMDAQPAAEPLVSSPAPAPAHPHPAALAPSEPAQTPAATVETPAKPDKPARPARARRDTRPVFRFLSRTLHGGVAFRQRLGQVFGRILPGAQGQPGSLSPGTMAFIAIAIPLMIVVTAVVIFVERGQEQLYQQYYTQAYNNASETQSLTDPVSLRIAWNLVLQDLEKAEANRPDRPETAALRQQAQTSLDRLDYIQRLPYQPAIIGELSPSIRVSRIAASSSDLYLLDSAQGRVLRAILTGNGYEMDTTFRCEPGTMGDLIIGPFIDMALLPRGSELSGSIVAMDASGNLVTCGPGIPASAFSLTPPDNNWGAIAGFTYEEGSLYVVDTLNNGIWVYNQGGLRDAPHSYYQISGLADVIDLAVNRDDLYLLFKDGHMATCTAVFIQGYSSKCENPAPYSDPRPGRQPNPVTFEDTQFLTMQTTEMPEASIYLLESQTGAVYHLSLRLNFQKQIQPPVYPANPFPQDRTATAMGISPNRILFVAFGNQVFYERLP